jgi:hypothetical protein
VNDQDSDGEEDDEDSTAATLPARRPPSHQVGGPMDAAPAPGTGARHAATDSEEEVPERVAGEVRTLQAALRESSARVGELEQQLKVQEANATAAVSSPSTPSSSEDSGAVRRLQAKLGELKARIDEGNEERRELRRKLATASRTRSNTEERSSLTARPEADSDDGVPVEMAVRGVLVPRLSRRAEDALRAMPAHIAAESMRTLGSLSAGDRAAWHRVKQAKDMSFALLMARVGIHHRLLFRADDGVLEVLDLVTRESLDTTLKRLRSV